MITNLLRDDDVNVTDAAARVGYANLSHFAEVFRYKYGMNPSELLHR
ncbi:helix-turn-helix domain-containing protein [Paenibacillus thiaminolyticus]|uniref:Helix-turn-helix domain-containing protein n=1 Tax=Paenibacillus thiaminolyticus TaxID=49283 RepID=A0A3A3H631_PANTH|nr:helix-turn-helix domain-containing protein [Paenibacillus thiaminolyticus]